MNVSGDGARHAVVSMALDSDTDYDGHFDLEYGHKPNARILHIIDDNVSAKDRVLYCKRGSELWYEGTYYSRIPVPASEVEEVVRFSFKGRTPRLILSDYSRKLLVPLRDFFHNTESVHDNSIFVRNRTLVKNEIAFVECLFSLLPGNSKNAQIIDKVCECCAPLSAFHHPPTLVTTKKEFNELLMGMASSKTIYMSFSYLWPFYSWSHAEFD